MQLACGLRPHLLAAPKIKFFDVMGRAVPTVTDIRRLKSLVPWALVVFNRQGLIYS